MPGFLYTYQKFREEIETSDRCEQDAEQDGAFTAHDPSVYSAPFERDVLKDLPEKLEENVYAKMEGEAAGAV